MANDKGKLETLAWSEARPEIQKFNPTLAKLIDELDPGEDHFFLKATYPFGGSALEKANLVLPNDKDGTLVPITDSSVSNKVKEAIGYNLNSNPVSIILKNTFEVYLPLPDRTIPLNGLMQPGTTFGTFRILNPDGSQQPKFLWNMTAGARSMFMLPRITETKKHMHLKKKYGLTADKPASLINHWEIFKQLSRYSDFPQPWDAEILFFSKKWFEHQDDPKWFGFYYYFHRSVWSGTEFVRNQPIWNLIFSLILQDYETRPSAYITDTTKYLMHVAIGAQPGFAPASNNLAGPIEGLQEIYSEDYELKNYPPIIMVPERFNMLDATTSPVYYSLQFPTAIEFGKSSRLRPSLIHDLHDIRALMMRYEKDLLADKYQVENTPIYDLFKKVKFDYFHNHVELHTGMRNSSEMAKEDPNLLTTVNGRRYKEFPDMCSFVKGCVRLSHK